MRVGPSGFRQGAALALFLELIALGLSFGLQPADEVVAQVLAYSGYGALLPPLAWTIASWGLTVGWLAGLIGTLAFRPLGRVVLTASLLGWTLLPWLGGLQVLTVSTVPAGMAFTISIWLAAISFADPRIAVHFGGPMPPEVGEIFE